MTIPCTIVSRIASVPAGTYIICGNSGDTITFTFDSEWDEHTEKTARFCFGAPCRPQYIDVPFTGDTCEIPAMHSVHEVFVGVYAGSIRTSTAAKIPCVRCITDDRPPPLCAYDDVYRQLTEILRHIPH